jgi:uridine kinase
MEGRRKNTDIGTRDELLNRLAEAVGSVTIAHPTRVAVEASE